MPARISIAVLLCMKNYEMLYYKQFWDRITVRDSSGNIMMTNLGTVLVVILSLDGRPLL